MNSMKRQNMLLMNWILIFNPEDLLKGPFNLPLPYYKSTFVYKNKFMCRIVKK